MRKNLLPVVFLPLCLVGLLCLGAGCRGGPDMPDVHQAAREGDLASIVRYVEMGGDIDARDPEGRTPLMYSVMHGLNNLVEELLRMGADHSIADNNGQTPYQRAEAELREEIVEIFSAWGAR